MKPLFDEYKELLFNYLLGPDYNKNYLNLIARLNNKGYSKKEIYELFLLLHKEIQIDSRTKNNEKLYNDLSDFMDGFTQWGKDVKILPNEPDIE